MTYGIRSAPLARMLICSVAIACGHTPVDAQQKKKPSPRFIEVSKNSDGDITDLDTNIAAAPKSLLGALPNHDDERRLNKHQIRELADKYDLRKRTEVNPHLRFKDGDISFWEEQNLAAWELEFEFLARQQLLKAADEQEVTIPTQGDLSQWAAKVSAALQGTSDHDWHGNNLGRELAKWVMLTVSEGKLVNVDVVRSRVQPALLPDRNTKRLEKPKINDLAKEYGLFGTWSVNPHLRFRDGDISFFYEQDLTAWEVTLEFIARSAVLHAAESKQAKIASPGDLSHWATKVYGGLVKKTREKWNAKKKSSP